MDKSPVSKEIDNDVPEINSSSSSVFDEYRFGKSQLSVKNEKPQSGRSLPEHLVLSDIYSAKEKSDKPAGSKDSSDIQSSSKGKSDKPPDSKWTVVVDLTTTFVDAGGRSGAELQDAKLRELQDKSKAAGKDVSMLVQTAKADVQGSEQVQRWMIRDGKMTELGSEPSKGYAADLKDLLVVAGKQTPSEHIALISQSHGLGADGIVGDTGVASLDDIKKSIKDGLAGTQHQSLDVLDFDACTMASLSVQEKLSGVAKHIVSSEEVMEGEGGKYDLQDLKSVVSGLMTKPDMTPAEFSKDIVAGAARGDNRPKDANGKPIDSEQDGTHTISSFDSAKYDKFKTQLDEFGSALIGVYDDAAGRKVIDRIVGETPSFTGDRKPNHPAGDGERDLKTFTEKIIQAISDGSLPDPSGKLTDSAQKLLKSQKEFTPAYYGHAGADGYDKDGGLSVYLPHGNNRDYVRKQIEESLSADLSGKDRESQLSNAKGLTQFYESATPGGSAQTAQLETVLKQMQSAGSDADFQKAVEGFVAARKSLIGTGTEDQLVDARMKYASGQRKGAAERHAPSGDGGWRHFYDDLVSAETA